MKKLQLSSFSGSENIIVLRLWTGERSVKAGLLLRKMTASVVKKSLKLNKVPAYKKYGIKWRWNEYYLENIAKSVENDTEGVESKYVN